LASNRGLAELNVTRLAIAHRLSTIRAADRIVVLERARLGQSGTYDELMARAGPVRRAVAPAAGGVAIRPVSASCSSAGT